MKIDSVDVGRLQNRLFYFLYDFLAETRSLYDKM